MLGVYIYKHYIKTLSLRLPLKMKI